MLSFRQNLITKIIKNRTDPSFYIESKNQTGFLSMYTFVKHLNSTKI